METSHKDGMVFDASERRRNNNSSKGVSLSRIDESNITYEQTDGFRRIQEEIRNLYSTISQQQRSYSFNEELRTRVEGVLQREIRNFYSGDANTRRLLKNTDKILLLAGELKKNGYYDGTRQIKRNKINAEWLDVKARQMVYGKWLSTSSLQHEEGLLRRHVEKAQKVNKYILDNLDEKGQRLPNTINNSNDILRHLRTSTFKSCDTVKDIVKFKGKNIFSIHEQIKSI